MAGSKYGAAAKLRGSRLAALDRCANRVARFLLPVLEFAFWLALIAVAVAAGLGGRPVLR
jgi:hypothetical protein